MHKSNGHSLESSAVSSLKKFHSLLTYNVSVTSVYRRRIGMVYAE